MASTKKTAASPGASSSGIRHIPAGEFKATCLELMDEVKERYVEYVVTKRGVPVAKLAPVDVAAPTPFGFLSGTVLEEHDLVSPDSAEWEESDGDPLDER